MDTPCIKNVKIRFTVIEKITTPKDIVFTACGPNFYTVAIDNYRYTVFPHKKCVNSCGIRDFDEIPIAITAFEEKFDVKSVRESLTVDNTTAVGILNLPNRLDLYAISHAVHGIKSQSHHKRLFNSCNVTVRPKTLPCAIIRRKKKPTINIFKTGKYTIMGGKNMNAINEAAHILSIIREEIQNNCNTSLESTICDAMQEWASK